METGRAHSGEVSEEDKQIGGRIILQEEDIMTELEKMQRAKMYIDKMANGINPIDGSMIPDEDVVNNVRLSRCFFYVADVLGQVIDNGGTAPQKKIKKEPFSLPVEKRKEFAFSDVPILLICDLMFAI